MPEPRKARARGAGGRGDVLLVALLDGEIVGHVRQRSGGMLSFLYEDTWRSDPNSYPISHSLPLAAREHPHEPTISFLWGLLPDNTRALAHYARRFGVSSGNPAALLAYLGADCAGAVQFATPENVEVLLEADRQSSAEVEWIDEAEIATELSAVRARGAPGTPPLPAGQFSLAGAQPKIALLEEDGRWGRPSGRTPTNRILKPPTGDFRDFAENEHICVSLARVLGLGAVQSRVERFGNEIAIVVDRYDRARRDGRYHRIHQEDICQALGIMHTRKYENEGGPGLGDIVSLLRDISEQSQADIDRLIGAAILNWILAGTDAHAKNYALLHGPGRATRLAPLYDIASYLPDADPQLYRVKLAMRIGGEYLVRRIGRTHWAAFANAVRLPVHGMLERVDDMLTRFPAALDEVHARAISDGLDERVVEDLTARIRERVNSCRRGMKGGLNPVNQPANKWSD